MPDWNLKTMSNLKSQIATSSSTASYIPKLEFPNRNTQFYVRLLFAFTVYHTFFYEDSHNLGISAEKEDKTICLSELPYPLFPYIFFANVFKNAAISGLASSFRSISWSVCDAVSAFVISHLFISSVSLCMALLYFSYACKNFALTFRVSIYLQMF